MKGLLSIQSHVAHGYVGGKAAIFPLQCQGWNVDNVNTVEFSNHTGYGAFDGSSIDIKTLKDVLSGLLKLGDAKYEYILTGYIPNATLIQEIHDFVKKYKEREPHTLYLLDPVLGDNDYLYVDKSCIPTYRSILHDKLVDIVTPNQFEFELLVDNKVDTNTKLMEGLQKLLVDIRFVVITSITTAKDELACVAATRTGSAMFKIKKIDSYFTGVGDLFSAMLLDKIDRNLKSGENDFKVLVKSVNQVLTIMNRTLLRTKNMAIEEYSKDFPDATVLDTRGCINDANMKYFELKIVQSKEYFSYDGEGDFEEQEVNIE